MEETPQTGSGNTAEPGTGTPPQSSVPAIPSTPATEPATDEDTVTLKRKDYNNLVSDRDRANNNSKIAEDYAFGQMVRTEIKGFLKSNKDKYPDVVVDDLLQVDDPDKLPEVAQAMQDRITGAVTARLEQTQVADQPTLSPEQKEQQLKKLKARAENGDPDAFSEMVQLQNA